MINLQRKILLFDGASKGNPGEEGGGGVLITLNGFQETIYSWGLGDEINNVTEALSLWKGLC